MMCQIPIGPTPRRLATLLWTTTVLCSAMTMPGRAQETGKIQGTVLDPNGEPVPAAQVVVVGTSFGALTNEQGFYFVNNVPAGTYEVWVQFIGYQPTELRGVRVQADQTVTVNFQLSGAAIEITAVEVPIVPREVISRTAIAYLPMAPWAEFSERPIPGIPSSVPTCSRVPTQQEIEVGSFAFNNEVLTREQARHLGIAGIGAGLDRNSRVLLVEWTRYRTCPTQLPGVLLRYGQSVRATIEVLEYNSELRASFALLAADATLKRRSQRILVRGEGISSRVLDSLIATISGKDLNVENYTAFMGFQSGLALVARDPTLQVGVVRLGVEGPRFGESVATVFGLSELADGRDCQDAISRLPDDLHGQHGAVMDVYVNLTSECSEDDPSGAERAAAREYLAGLRVRR
jgi:hypothetical protein